MSDGEDAGPAGPTAEQPEQRTEQQTDGQTERPEAKEGSLRVRALRGSAWSAVQSVASQALRFGTNLVLTRLLVPEAFGAMLLVNTFLHGLEMLSDLGIQASIVQHPDGDHPDFLHTAWTVQILRGFVLWGLCMVAAGPFASFYHQPVLKALIPVAGISALLGGFRATGLASKVRHISVAWMTRFQLIVQGIAVAVMVTWAFFSPTVWALVAGRLAGSTAELVLGHALVPGPRDRLGWHKAFLGALFGFGSWVFFNTMLGYLSDYVDRFALGRVLSAQQLGVYQIAVMVAGLPFLLMLELGASVVFPTFGRARDAGRDLVQIYHRIRIPIAVVGAVLVAGLFGGGDALIHFLYPPAFHGAGWMLGFVVAGQWFRILSIAPSNALFALGKPNLLLVANGSKLLAYSALVPLGYHVAGVEGALTGFAAGEAVGWIVYSVMLGMRKLATPWQDLQVTGWLVVVAGSAFGLQQYMLHREIHPLVVTLACGLVATLPWAGYARTVLRMLRPAPSPTTA